MAQEYTLRLNINADGSQAISEANRVRRAFDGAGGAPGSASATPTEQPAADELSRHVTSALGNIRNDISSALGNIRNDISSALSGIRRSIAQESPSSTAAPHHGRSQTAAPRAAQPALHPAQTALASGGASFLTGFGGAMRIAMSAMTGALGIVKLAIGGVFSGLKTLAGFLSGAFSSAWRLPIKLMKTFIVAAGSVTAAVYTIKKALDPAGRMQQFRQQLEVMTKSPAEASRRLKLLSKYAKDTNFSPDEVIGAGNRLQAFGMYSFRTLRLAGDAANAFGKSIDEVVQSLSYLNAGRGGEALESLSRFGVTRDKLREYGVKFGKSGQLETAPKKAVKAVLAYFENEYGGMTKRVGKTWVGAMQQVGGEVFDALAKGFSGALKPATDFVTKKLIPVIGRIGDALKGVDWQTALEGPLRIASALLDTLGNLANPETREKGMEQLKGLWDGFKAVGDTFLRGLGGVFGGALQSIGSTFGNLVRSGAFLDVFKAGASLFSVVFQGGVMLFKSVLFSFTPDFQMMLESILEKIPLLNYKSEAVRDAERVSDNYLNNVLEGNKYNPLGLSEDKLDEMRRFIQDEYERKRHLGGYKKHFYKDINDGKPLDELDTDELSYFMASISGDFKKRFEDDIMAGGLDRIKADNRTALERQQQKMAASINDMVGNLGKAVGKVAVSVDISPLKSAVSGLYADIGESIRDNVSPAISAILADSLYPGDYEGVKGKYGSAVAAQWRKVTARYEDEDEKAEKAHRKWMRQQRKAKKTEETDADYEKYLSGRAERRRRLDAERRAIVDRALSDPRNYDEIRAAYGSEVAGRWQAVRDDARARDAEALSAHRSRISAQGYVGEDTEWKEWNSRASRKVREDEVARLQKEILDNARASLKTSRQTARHTGAVARSSDSTAKNTGMPQKAKTDVRPVYYAPDDVRPGRQDRDETMKELGDKVAQLSAQVTVIKSAVIDLKNLVKPISNAYAGA